MDLSIIGMCDEFDFEVLQSLEAIIEAEIKIRNRRKNSDTAHSTAAQYPQI